MTNRKFTRLVGKNQLNTHLNSAHLQINGKLRSSTIYIGAIRHQLNRYGVISFWGFLFFSFAFEIQSKWNPLQQHPPVPLMPRRLRPVRWTIL